MDIYFSLLRSQFGTSNSGDKMGLRYAPYVFTEQGVAMLSSVLNSKQAIQVNIRIIRIFTFMRKMYLDNSELRLAIEEIRKKTESNTKNIEVVFRYLDEFIGKKESQEPRKTIGFNT